MAKTEMCSIFIVLVLYWSNSLHRYCTSTYYHNVTWNSAYKSKVQPFNWSLCSDNHDLHQSASYSCQWVWIQVKLARRRYHHNQSLNRFFSHKLLMKTDIPSIAFVDWLATRQNAHQVIYSKITYSHSGICFANEVVMCNYMNHMPESTSPWKIMLWLSLQQILECELIHLKLPLFMLK